MIDILIDTLLDTVKMIPFLFIAFLIMEFIEHKVSKKNKNVIEKSGKFGPILGSLLGAFPQCGFSAAATNLYAARVITIGTLVSIYLSTSDEMLPILLEEQIDIKIVISIIIIKIVIGMLVGLIVDLLLRKKEKEHIHDICEQDHCDCKHGIIVSSIKHTIKIVLFILIINLVLNTIMDLYGVEFLEKIFLKGSLISPFIASLVGLIPNCAASVLITELYLSGAISFGSTIGGLLTGSGIGILLLFKENKNIKENLMILGIIYFVGVFFGLLFNILGIAL